MQPHRPRIPPPGRFHSSGPTGNCPPTSPYMNVTKKILKHSTEERIETGYPHTEEWCWFPIFHPAPKLNLDQKWIKTFNTHTKEKSAGAVRLYHRGSTSWCVHRQRLPEPDCSHSGVVRADEWDPMTLKSYHPVKDMCSRTKSAYRTGGKPLPTLHLTRD